MHDRYEKRYNLVLDQWNSLVAERLGNDAFESMYKIFRKEVRSDVIELHNTDENLSKLAQLGHEIYI